MTSSQYPALLDLATNKLYPLRSATSFLVGRNETADICVLDTTCSRHHFRVVRKEGMFFVEPLAPHNPTLCDGLPITQAQPLQHDCLLQAGTARFRFLLHESDKAEPEPKPEIKPSDIVRTIRASTSDIASVTVQKPFQLSGLMQIGRQEDSVDIYLPHPQVSRIHSSIDCSDGQTILRDLESANGTFVNGQRITDARTLTAGDQIDIGPYALQFTGKALIPRARSNNIELIARNIRRIVTDRATGRPLTLLDDISLVVRPREFVCILGPSGSGKSTLLSALSGRVPADEGLVLLNGTDLYQSFDALKQDMVVVPQRDVLHESLSVGQALWYTAKLRLPPDTAEYEIQSGLKELLATVGLEHRRATTIRHLSGGQIKRASLANEILCKPSLLFLDEVTSGLDEQTDREMMDLFRSLADAGKTVLCITHSLANVERTCHLVVILTSGGKLAFVGKPSEALSYFEIERLGDVYDRLAEQSPEHWQQAFLQSECYSRYITERLPDPKPLHSPNLSRAESSGEQARAFFRQSVLLTRRYFAVMCGDWPSLVAMAGQGLLVALLLSIVFGNISKIENPMDHAQRSVNLLFLLAVSCFWFGCNNASKEIVKERPIFVREHDFNLGVGSYYTSKFILLSTFSCMQTVVLFIIVQLWCKPPGEMMSQLLLLLTLAITGVTLGLAISAFSKTEEMAITLIPMAVIPQIILAGVIAPLSGLSKGMAMLMITVYWGKSGLDGSLPKSVTQSIGLQQTSLIGALIVILAHAIVGIVIALIILHLQGKRERK